MHFNRVRGINFTRLVIGLLFLIACSESDDPDTKLISDFDNHYDLLYVYNNEIYTIRSDGSEPQQITHNSYYDHEAIWSPDGDQILFVSSRTDDWKLDIYKMDRDGSNEERLTFHKESSQHPFFSPNGEIILYRSWINIYTMNRHGSDTTQIGQGSLDNHMTPWSPDSRSFVFTDRELYRYDVETKIKTQLTSNNDGSSNPSWSPDGNKITYVSAFEGNVEVYVVDSDGSNQINLSDASGWDHFPCWSPDGSKLLFVSDRDGDKDVYMINTDGTGLINLSNDDWESYYLPTWSPDMTRISYAVDTDGDTANDSIYIVDLETGAKFLLATGWTSPRWH